MTKPLSVALVGCGAIAQQSYLPALADVPEITCTWLVDVRRDLTAAAARRYGIPNTTDRYHDVLDSVEAVILAVPNHLHESMVCDALIRRRAVLCEKPLGRTVAEVRHMTEVARQAGVPLVAAMVMRLFPGLRYFRDESPWNSVGEVQEIRASYGCPLNWPVPHLAFFDRSLAGGGVFLDLGVHVIDALLSRIGVRVERIEGYWDDADAGTESEARALLTVHLPGGCRATSCVIETSRLRGLVNSIEIRGTTGVLTVPLSWTAFPALREGTGASRPLINLPPESADCFVAQLKAFANHVRSGGPAEAEGSSQVDVLNIIESCYGQRQSLRFPWEPYVAWPGG
jgi:predicted dehydrogenase